MSPKRPATRTLPDITAAAYHAALAKQADFDFRWIYEYSFPEPENAAGQLYRLEENILKLADMPGKLELY